MLSTHHMDEVKSVFCVFLLIFGPRRGLLYDLLHIKADIVGDRIAIISSGRLKCVGSPLFLKSQLGDGYHLTLVKQQTADDGDSAFAVDANSSTGSSGFQSNCDAAELERFLQKYVSRVQLQDSTLHELHFSLQPTTNDQLMQLCEALECDGVAEDLRISGFGIRDLTLEEIFLKVTAGEISMLNEYGELVFGY